MSYEERIVAFIDILGFRNLVNDESRCEDIGAILRLPYLIRQDHMAKMLKIKGVMMTSISDSLVFSIGLEKRGAMNKITKILTVFMQALMTQYGLLVRGGLAVGKLYHDNDVVYGPGLVRAHELESRIAVYPRVIMTPADFECSIRSCGEISQSILRKTFILDNDWFLRLDSVRYATQETLELYRSRLEQSKTLDLGVLQKVNWMIAEVDRKSREEVSRLSR